MNLNQPDVQENMRKISTGLALTLSEEQAKIHTYITIIFRFQGDFQSITDSIDIKSVELLNGFAVATASPDQIRRLSKLSQILYIDLTRQLEYEQAVSPSSRTQACFPVFDPAGTILKGDGILVGIIDSGIDFYHPAFLRANGDSSIITYWDQNNSGTPPEPYGFGNELGQHQINSLIRTMRKHLPPDPDGHGTAVTSIITALSPDTDIIGVAAQPDTASFLCAIDYAVRYARSASKPLVLNLSYGNNYGAHDGSSLVEQYLDLLPASDKITVVTGTGNEGGSGRHANIDARKNRKMQILVSPGIQTFNLQLWSEFSTPYRFHIRSPYGAFSEDIVSTSHGSFRAFTLSGTDIRIQIGLPSPYSTKQEIFLQFEGGDRLSGNWDFVFYPVLSSDFHIDAWLPVAASTSSSLMFESPDTELTLTIPSTAATVITVGAYDNRRQTIAPFSGQGAAAIQKPDLVAPGVDILVANSGGGYRILSGTSFAVPFVSAACANLMQWGITDQNDSFLFASRLKAYLRRGAIPLIGTEIPNPQSGWGRLCADNSLPPSG